MGQGVNCVSVVNETVFGGLCFRTGRGQKEPTFLTADLAIVDNPALPPPANASQFSTELFLNGFAH